MLVMRPEACVFMHASFAMCDNLQMRIKTNMYRGLLSKALSPKILCPSWFDTRESKARQQLHLIHSWLPRCWQAISRRNLSSVEPMLLSILGQKRKKFMLISFFLLWNDTRSHQVILSHRCVVTLPLEPHKSYIVGEKQPLQNVRENVTFSTFRSGMLVPVV